MCLFLEGNYLQPFPIQTSVYSDTGRETKSVCPRGKLFSKSTVKNACKDASCSRHYIPPVCLRPIRGLNEPYSSFKPSVVLKLH